MGDEQEMNGRCWGNISRASIPLFIGILRDLREMLAYFEKIHQFGDSGHSVLDKYSLYRIPKGS